MKNRKFIALALVIFAMGVTACGGGNASKESKGGSTPAASQSTSKPSVAPKPSLSVSSLDITGKDGKAYLEIKGTAKNFKAEDFKWALSIQHAGLENYDASTDYILGAATFTDADYKHQVAIAENGAFTFSYCLSDIQGIAAGFYRIAGGPKGHLIDAGTANDGLKAKDGSFRYYIRNDEEVESINTLIVETLPPFALAEASVVKDEAGKIWAKVGGDLKAGITQEILDGYDSYVEWENTSNWRRTKLSKASSQFYYKVEGTKAYLYADISSFEANANYNTHLNVTENKNGDAKMDEAIDAHYIYPNSKGTMLDINVYSNPNASTADKAEFWGNLGFKVTAAAAGAEEGPVAK